MPPSHPREAASARQSANGSTDRTFRLRWFLPCCIRQWLLTSPASSLRNNSEDKPAAARQNFADSSCRHRVRRIRPLRGARTVEARSAIARSNSNELDQAIRADECPDRTPGVQVFRGFDHIKPVRFSLKREERRTVGEHPD